MGKKKLLALLLATVLAMQPTISVTAETGQVTDAVGDYEGEETKEESKVTALENTESAEPNSPAVDEEMTKMTSAEKEEADDGETEYLSLSADPGLSNDQTTSYAHSEEATSGTVTLKAEWNDPELGKPTTFHVSATGGSGNYKFSMAAPSYSSPNQRAFESVADPSRGEWMNYTSECASNDYTFTMTATGTYKFWFNVMDTKAGVYYLRLIFDIDVSNSKYPSVDSIVQSAVAKCNSKITNGSQYEKALWLHDWLLDQLEYDTTLKWSSAESALTRKLGTCQAYESAYAKLLTAAGIENSETRDTYDGHTWNAMKLDGEWYQVDCTWDDTKAHWYNFDQKRLYFGLTDELMAIAHPGYAKIYTVENYGTRSTSLKNNYFVRSGEAQKWADAYVEKIQKNLNEGKTEFSVAADNASYPPSISGIQNGIIAYVLNQMKWSVDGKPISLQVDGGEKKFTFTAAKNDSATEEKSHSYTLSLDGTIAINLYMELPEPLALNQEAYMEFTLPNGSVSQVKVKDAVKKDGYYIFTCRVAAKEMAADVKARMVADGQRGKEYTVSVQRYADYVLNHTTKYSTTTVKLVKAMLNYGASAQTMFNYHTDKMANEILSDTDKQVAKVDFSAYKPDLKTDPNENGISCYAGSLCLESDTSIKDYFVLKGNANIDEYVFYSSTNGGAPVKLEPQKTTLNGKVCYAVEIKNIKAQNLNQSVVVTVQKKDNPNVNVIELSFNAFSYAYVMANMTSPNKKAVNVTNAMYAYWKLAKQYVDGKTKQ